jgi:hypothetical protein
VAGSWWIALGTALAAALAVVALMPLRLRLGVAADAFGRRWRLRLEVETAWGLVRWRVGRGSHGAGDGRAPPARRGRPSGGRGDPPPGAAVVAVRRVWAAVRVRRARLQIELGAADAALTAVGCGVLWALGAALLAALPGLRPERAALRVRPCYGGRGRFVGRAVVDADLRLWQAAWLAVSLRGL